MKNHFPPAPRFRSLNAVSHQKEAGVIGEMENLVIPVGKEGSRSKAAGLWSIHSL